MASFGRVTVRAAGVCGRYLSGCVVLAAVVIDVLGACGALP
jgi:hypothetical protein